LPGWAARRCWRVFWGNDAEQKELAGFLEKAKIDTNRRGVDLAAHYFEDADRRAANSSCCGWISRVGRSRVKPIADALMEAAEQLAGKVHAVVLSDYAKGCAGRRSCASG